MSHFVSRRCSILGKGCETVLRAIPVLAMSSEINYPHLLDLPVLNHLHLDLSFKKAHHSHNSRQSHCPAKQ